MRSKFEVRTKLLKSAKEPSRDPLLFSFVDVSEFFLKGHMTPLAISSY
jgi:hypothetical protein